MESDRPKSALEVGTKPSHRLEWQSSVNPRFPNGKSEGYRPKLAVSCDIMEEYLTFSGSFFCSKRSKNGLKIISF